MELDWEMDHLLNTVLSLEEDYRLAVRTTESSPGAGRAGCSGMERTGVSSRGASLDLLCWGGTAIETPKEKRSDTSSDAGATCRNQNRAKQKRKKTIFTKEQSEYLKRAFENDPYPDFKKRTQLSELTGIAESRVQVWFQNRRARHLPRMSQRSAPYYVPQKPQVYAEGAWTASAHSGEVSVGGQNCLLAGLPLEYWRQRS
ncbi:SIAM protein, partial [Polypterus senegalus]